MIPQEEPAVDFVYYMTLHATEAFTFPLLGAFANSSRTALRNNVCRTALLSTAATYLHTVGTGIYAEATVMLPSPHDGSDDPVHSLLSFSNIVEGHRVSQQKQDNVWRIPVPPVSCRVLIQSKPHHEALIETNQRQVSLYGLHSDTHELIAFSDCDNLDQVIQGLLPKTYWHQRLAKFSDGRVTLNTQRVFSRWQRWMRQGLSLSQRYAALEAGLLSGDTSL